MSGPEFHPFQKIARLSRDIVITEKIDGTNGVIYIPDEVERSLFGYDAIYAGSRSRWVTPGKTDNMGFAAWVYLNSVALISALGPGLHYGEWWGRGIQRGYDQDRKRFSLFNPFRYIVPLDALFSVVPVLYEGPFDQGAINYHLAGLQMGGSVAAPGFMDPEGIVVYHTASKALFKKTIKGDEKPKGSRE